MTRTQEADLAPRSGMARRLPLLAGAAPVAGTLLSWTTAGYVHSLTAGEAFAGVCTRTVRIGGYTADGDGQVDAMCGQFLMTSLDAISGIDQTDVANATAIYASDDSTLTETAGTNTKIGAVAGLDGTRVVIMAATADVGASDSPPAPTSATDWLITGLLTLSGIEDTLTAHAGGTQAAALALSASKLTHRISTCATAADSVKLPTLVVGAVHQIINDGAASAQVYGAGTSTIDAVATATGVALASGARASFFAYATGKWVRIAHIDLTALTSATDWTISGLLTLSGIEDSLTAHAGGTQAAALALSASVPTHRISTCATAGDSVKLPVLVVGAVHQIINDGATAAQVYGAGTSTIDGVATATGVLLQAGARAIFFGYATGKWVRVAHIDQIPAVTVLTDAATVTLDASSGDKKKYRVTIAGNRTLAITNPTDGQVITLEVIQGAGGSRLFDMSALNWTAALAEPTKSTVAGTRDRFVLEYSTLETKWDVLSYSLGY